MKREVSPIIAVVGILAALTAVQVAYWRGLVGGPPEGLGGGGGRAGSQAGAAPPAGSSSATVSTVAGGPGAGHRDGPSASALFDGPAAVAVGSDGSIYVADSRNHCVRLVSREGAVSTLAGAAGQPGFADGPADEARFSAPAGIAIAPDGALLVADTGNHRIRRITPTGDVTTYAGAATPVDDLGRPLGGRRDGSALEAEFRFPAGLAVDEQGAVYVADAGNRRVCRVSPTGAVATLPMAGAERLDTPTQVAIAPDGRLWVSDTGAGALWTAGDGEPLERRMPADAESGPSSPTGIAAVPGEGPQPSLYVLGYGDNCLWRLDGEAVTLVAGEDSAASADWQDGPGDAARFSRPAGLAAAANGDLYVADFGNNCVRRVRMSDDGKEAG